MKEQIPVSGKAPTTNASEVLEDIQAGVFMQLVGRALTEVAAHTVEHGRTGKIRLDLDLKRMGESCQVMVISSLEYKHPTRRGAKSESVEFETPMYVGSGGALSITPETMQMDLQNGGHPHVGVKS